MISCLMSGVTGLNANDEYMSIIANNIANVNTNGYKAQQITFADIFNQKTGNFDIGGGVEIGQISSIHTQGNLEATTRSTDLAIDGQGFFIVKNESGTFYTRAGQFNINPDGELVNPQGLVVQGWDIREDETFTRTPSDINLANTSLAPNPTENIGIAVNLDANATVPVAGFDPADPLDTSNYSTSTSIYDSLGNQHTVTFYFCKTDTNEWEWHALEEGADTPTQWPNGTLSFDEHGVVIPGQSSPTATFNFNNGSAADQTLTIDFGDSTGGSTQSASNFSTFSLKQDGYGAGSLVNISVTEEGKIRGFFTNGYTCDIALIALADFTNPEGLQNMGNNLYSASQNSGQAAINPPGTAGIGIIKAYNLEGSNVDLASEFMKMIIAQRVFQANARSITVADQMLTEIVSLKR